MWRDFIRHDFASGDYDSLQQETGGRAGTADDLPVIAERLGVGYETVRSHARAVFAKTAVSSRLALMRLLHSYS